MSKVFLSHSSHDDPTVRSLQQALADLGQELWIDSRELRGGDPLGPSIRTAIDSAAGFAVLVSPKALESKWVLAELRHALQVQRERLDAGTRYPVVPLALDGTRLGPLEAELGHEPIYIRLDSRPGGIESALNAILVALHKRAPADRLPVPQPQTGPLEELVLELTDLGFDESEPGVRRASATARLIYEPAGRDARADARDAGGGKVRTADPTAAPAATATPMVRTADPTGAGPSRRVRCADQTPPDQTPPDQTPIAAPATWRLIAPLGPIETEELRWYLEKYAVWPSTYFQDRARRVEQSLVEWGQALHQAALPPEHTREVLRAWSAADPHAGRRFSVEERGRPAREAPGRDAPAPLPPCWPSPGSYSTTAKDSSSKAPTRPGSAAACRARKTKTRHRPQASPSPPPPSASC